MAEIDGIQYVVDIDCNMQLIVRCHVTNLLYKKLTIAKMQLHCADHSNRCGPSISALKCNAASVLK